MRTPSRPDHYQRSCDAPDPGLGFAAARRAPEASAGFAFEVRPADVDETPRAGRSRRATTRSASRATRRVSGRRGAARARLPSSSPPTRSSSVDEPRSSASRAATGRCRDACCDCCPASVHRGADRRSSCGTASRELSRGRHDARALPAAERRLKSPGTSRPASRDGKAGAYAIQGRGARSSTGSRARGRTSSGCRSRRSTACSDVGVSRLTPLGARYSEAGIPRKSL